MKFAQNLGIEQNQLLTLIPNNSTIKESVLYPK